MSTGAARPGRAGAARLWLRLFWLSTALTLAVGATLVPHLRDSAELVRMRNALLLHRVLEELKQLRLAMSNAPLTGDPASEPPPPHY